MIHHVQLCLTLLVPETKVAEFANCVDLDKVAQNRNEPPHLVVVVVLLFYVHGKQLRSCSCTFVHILSPVNLTTIFLGRFRPPKRAAVNLYFVHILSPVTDNCPS